MAPDYACCSCTAAAVDRCYPRARRLHGMAGSCCWLLAVLFLLLWSFTVTGQVEPFVTSQNELLVASRPKSSSSRTLVSLLCFLFGAYSLYGKLATFSVIRPSQLAAAPSLSQAVGH